MQHMYSQDSFCAHSSRNSLDKRRSSTTPNFALCACGTSKQATSISERAGLLLLQTCAWGVLTVLIYSNLAMLVETGVIDATVFQKAAPEALATDNCIQHIR